MKKILSICLLAAFVVAFSSCHKNCVCKKTYNPAGLDTTIVEEYDAVKDYSKKECESLSVADSTDESSITFECVYGK